MLVRGAELRSAGEAVEGHEHAEAATAEGERDVESRLGLQAEPLLLEPVAVEVVEALRPPRVHGAAGHRRLGTVWPDQVVGQLAGGVGHAEAVVVGEQNHQRPGRHQRSAALGHELEDRVEVDLAGQGARDLAGGAQRRDRQLELAAAALVAVEPASVVDADRRILGENGEQFLVRASSNSTPVVFSVR